jgi:hypothetical protein
MKKIIYTLLIMTMTSLNIAANNCEVTTEKFDTVEMNVKALMKVVKADSYRVSIPNKSEKDFLDFVIVDSVLKVTYKRPYYKEITEPITLIIEVPNKVRIITTREYTQHITRKTKD